MLVGVGHYSLLKQCAFLYAIVIVVALGGVSAKWFGDAYRVDSNIQEGANSVYWQSYDSGFTPWPHVGLDLTGRCDRLLGDLECFPIIVPSLNPADRRIHELLNLRVPFTPVPPAPLFTAGVILSIAYGVYALAGRLGKARSESLSS